MIKQALPLGLRQKLNLTARVFGTATAGVRRPPTFLIVGTKRGGTTSLWNWLLEHPLVLPMWPAPQNLKSSNYFFENLHQSWSWYLGHFPTEVSIARARRSLGASPAFGEASPYYMYDPRVAPKVAESLPEVKIIMLLRNPVERAFSHYKERVRNGVEPLSFEDALDAEAERTAGEIDRMKRDPLYYSTAHDYYSYQARGMYLEQLLQWRETIPKDRFLPLVSEDMYANPEAVFSQVTDFLGLPRVPISARRFNYHPAADMPITARHRLVDLYRAQAPELQMLLGRPLDW